MRVALLASLFLSSAAYAVPESQFDTALSLIESRGSFFAESTFRSPDGTELSYTKFGADLPGPKGCLVLSPGQGEPSLKYLEVAHDLATQGYAPIYSIDHRGQGRSARALPDRQKSHVNRFSDYVRDFHLFVNSIVLNDSACRGKPLSLLAHSMGGAIAALYLESAGERSPFRKAVLNAPMLKIAFPQGKTENSVLWETWFACNTPFGPGCTDFVPGRGAYDPSSPFAGNSYTHSELRFGFKKAVYAKWPELQVGGPTVRWVRESVIADQRLRSPKNAARVATPVLILQATADTVVDNSGQDEFCSLVRGCRIERVEGAKHEVLMESDSIRDPALSKIDAFLTAP